MPALTGTRRLPLWSKDIGYIPFPYVRLTVVIEITDNLKGWHRIRSGKLWRQPSTVNSKFGSDPVYWKYDDLRSTLISLLHSGLSVSKYIGLVTIPVMNLTSMVWFRNFRLRKFPNPFSSVMIRLLCYHPSRSAISFSKPNEACGQWSKHGMWVSLEYMPIYEGWPMCHL